MGIGVEYGLNDVRQDRLAGAGGDCVQGRGERQGVLDRMQGAAEERLANRGDQPKAACPHVGAPRGVVESAGLLPESSGLIRAGMPGPSSMAEPPTARATPVHSPFGSPGT